MGEKTWREMSVKSSILSHNVIQRQTHARIVGALFCNPPPTVGKIHPSALIVKIVIRMHHAFSVGETISI